MPLTILGVWQDAWAWQGWEGLSALSQIAIGAIALWLALRQYRMELEGRQIQLRVVPELEKSPDGESVRHELVVRIQNIGTIDARITAIEVLAGPRDEPIRASRWDGILHTTGEGTGMSRCLPGTLAAHDAIVARFWSVSQSRATGGIENTYDVLADERWQRVRVVRVRTADGREFYGRSAALRSVRRHCLAAKYTRGLNLAFHGCRR